MDDLILPELRMATKSANLELNEKVRVMQSEGKEVYHLAFGQSPFPIPTCFVNGLKARICTKIKKGLACTTMSDSKLGHSLS